MAYVLPRLPTADEIRDGRALSSGATRLHDHLHALALHVARTRAHAVLPDALTFHLPAVIVAALVGYSERHLYTLADELRAAGLIDERGHVAQIGKLRRYSGTLWSVALRPSTRPRLRWFDFRHDWRPDFAEDYHGEQGAFRQVQAVISEPICLEQKSGKIAALARTWAAATRTPKTPVDGGSEVRPGATLQAVAADLPALLHLHPRQRHREVSRLAAEVAHVLNEPGRLKQWAGTIYAALTAENEGCAGLNALHLALLRLAADLAEGAPWRKPGAVLAARLRPTC